MMRALQVLVRAAVFRLCLVATLGSRGPRYEVAAEEEPRVFDWEDIHHAHD